MPSRPLSYETALETLRVVNEVIEKQGGTRKGTSDTFTKAAATILGISPRTLSSRLELIHKHPQRFRGLHLGGPLPGKPAVDLPVFPDDDLPVPKLIDSMCARFERRLERKQAERWFRIGMPDNRPFALAVFGDPHMDSNGCNWPLLRQHCAIVAKTPGMYGANVGDLVDNWVGRLARLYGDSDQSKATGWKLVKWFLRESGIEWLVHVLGNHDQWNDGATIIRGISGDRVPVLNDEAKFYLETPNKVRWPVWVRHNFEGHSMWNALHGPLKAAKMKESASLYVCGHLHNWALHEEESASKDHIYWLARARGYKYLDPFQTALGHDAQEYGTTIVAVCDPTADRMPNRMRCFPDVEEAADYLTFKRRRKAA